MNEEIVRAEEKETEVYKCPNCGANLTFSPKLQKLYCEHCETVIDFEQDRNVVPLDFVTGGEKGEDWGEETVVYRCNNCGAKEIISKTDIARVCPFCGTTNIVETDELPGLRPTAVVPFAVDEASARASFKGWVKKKKLVPKAFKKSVTADDVNGIYNPCFVYNSNTLSSYQGRMGEYYTVTVGSGKNRRTETRIRWFNVSGNYALDFEDYMIEASPHLDQKTANKLKPFSYEQAALYDKKFLSGFTASGYDKDMDACWAEARAGMEQIIRQKIKDSYHADVVDYLNVNTGHYHVTYRYLLLPIWFCKIPYKKKKYDFYINGTTSKIVGKVPRSPGKICALVFGILAGLAGLGWLMYWLGSVL